MNVLAWLVVRSVCDLMSERIEFAELPRSRAEQTFFATLMTCCGWSTEMPACSTAARNSLSVAAALTVPARPRVAMPSAAAVRVVPATEAMKRRVNIGGLLVLMLVGGCAALRRHQNQHRGFTDSQQILGDRTRPAPKGP